MEEEMTSAVDSPVDEPPPRFNIFILLVPLAFGLGLLVGWQLWGRNAPAQAAESTSTAQASTAAQVEQIQRYPVPVDDDPARGPENAPITIIEFSDYECPYCRRWFDEVYERLLQTYPDEVRLVYRDFPLTSIHPNAQPAAEAANCANEQGAYWQFHDKLFGMQLPLGAEAYNQYASELGLDMIKFGQCLAERRYQAEVQSDLEYAANLGVNSTPTFFINGIPVIGAQSFDVFQYIIDKELAGELPK